MRQYAPCQGLCVLLVSAHVNQCQGHVIKEVGCDVLAIWKVARLST